MKSVDGLVEAYLDGLAHSDLPAVLGLFADEAVVHSPLYGSLPPADFYPALFADTAQARLELRGTMRGRSVTGAELLSFWFRFDWRLTSGVWAPFEVVDVAELDEDGAIRSLWIVYDTVDVRTAYTESTHHS
ncbi:nuclear transport factor 2 family protein [Herbidospora sp. NEAU-GS84]|uniref:Nuclear transport factor 2 family protein n=1 Tax=Herbidospora solisilvae TaxID=2696284 RepID=A0A7C9NL32_9ACTN|nr:nuclear transport factor 2 family protein [Herbidospora solisilvae]NAS25958.1 nuclear transport factor 2 family protein [Herbidospora solisilvae]